MSIMEVVGRSEDERLPEPCIGQLQGVAGRNAMEELLKKLAEARAAETAAQEVKTAAFMAEYAVKQACRVGRRRYSSAPEDQRRMADAAAAYAAAYAALGDASRLVMELEAELEARFPSRWCRGDNDPLLRQQLEIESMPKHYDSNNPHRD